MNSTEEFIYKGYYEGLSKHERPVNILKSQLERDSTTYYIYELDREHAVGERLVISYSHIFTYKRGLMLIGGAVCHE